MASCASAAILKGLPVNCDAALGGIKKVYIINHTDVASVSYVDKDGVAIPDPTAATGAIYVKPAPVATKKFLAYNFKKNSSSMESTLSKDDAIGLNYVSTALSLKFARMEAEKQRQIISLSLGEFAVIVLDANGEYWYLGLDNPVAATAGTGASGTAKEDGNSYTITLTDEANKWPYQLRAADVADIVEEVNE